MAGSRIKGITVEIGGDVTGLEKALQSVNSTIRTTQTQLKDVERLLKLDPSHTELLSQKQKLLSESVSATKQKLDALKTAQEQAKQQMESGDLGKDKYDALQREIIATEQELQRIAKEAADANTALTKIGETGATLENVGGKFTSVGKSLTTHVTLPIVAAGAAIVKTAGDFDQSMAQVKAITGATGDDFESLRDLAIDLGAKTAYSAVECADAMTEMGKAGWSTQQIIDGMSGVLDAAASSGEGLASVSTIVADAVSGFGLEAKDASRIADILAHSANAGTIDIADLGETFKYVAPMAQSMGLSIEDVTTATTAMSMAGIKGSQAGTSLRRMLTNLVKPTKSVSEAMDELGISITNEDGTFLSLDEIVGVLRESFSGLTDEEKAYYATTIAGSNGQSGMLALLNLSAEEYAILSEEMKNCTGEAERTATVMQDNLNSKIEQLGGALESLAIKLGDILLPKLKDLIERITGVIETFTQAPQPVQELVVKIALIAAAVGPVLLVFGKLTTAVGQGMQVFSTMGKGILNFVNQAKLGVGAGGKLAAAIGGISAPVVAVVAVIAVLAAAFSHLWKTNEEFRDKVTSIWDSVKAKFSEAGQKITEAINSLGFNFQGLGEAIKSAWDWFCNALEPLITGIIQNIATSLKGTIDIVIGIVQTIAGIIKGFKDGDWSLFLEGLKTMWTGIWEKFTAPVNAVISVISGYLEKFGTSWEQVWTGIKNFFVTVWEGINSFFSSTWNSIKSTFETVWNAIADTVSTVWEKIKNIVQVGILFVKELISAAFQLLTVPFRLIWENCKETVTAAWKTIKEKVSSALDDIKTAVTTAWTAVKTALQPILEGIKSNISMAWETVKTNVSNTVNAVKTVVTEAWNGIQTALAPIVERIKTTISSAWDTAKTNTSTALENIKTNVSMAWDNVKTNVSTAMDGIKDTISNGLDAAKTSVSNIFENIKTTIFNALENAKNTVSNAIESIKNLFNFSWSLPPLRLPHVSITGEFSLNPPSVPHFSIDWYRKAMQNGMILNKPTIFGMQGNRLLAGGEAGSEAVVGTKSLMEMIRNAVSSMANQTTVNYGGVTINVYAQPNQDIRELTDEIGAELNRKMRMAGSW